MTRYQLAKIVDWAGTLRTRKRMQKVVYLLQVKGCPLESEYRLHYYGPYSHDVARLTDEMVRGGMLDEKSEEDAAGERFSYRLSERARQQVAAHEAKPDGSLEAKQIGKFEDLARELLVVDLKELEVASTIVFFRKHGSEWHDAVDKTCQFKGLPPDTPFLKRTQELARRIID